MNLKRIAAVLSLAGGIAAVTAGTSYAQVTSMAGGCEFRLVSVQALDTQETPTDEIYLQIADERTLVRTFTEGQTREGSDFGNLDQITQFNPSGGSRSVSVFEDDPTVDTRIGRPITVRCVAGSFEVDRSDTAATATYRVSYVVTRLP